MFAQTSLALLLCLSAVGQAPPPPVPAPPAPAPVPIAAPAIGQPAPAFRLNDHTGKLATVGGAQSDGTWTLVAFYPKAATPG